MANARNAVRKRGRTGLIIGILAVMILIGGGGLAVAYLGKAKPVPPEKLAKVERGETSYYSPKITWKESWQSDEPVKSVELNMIAKIDTPEGPVPALAVNRNWLRNGVTQEQDGKAFRIEIEWLASNPGGWDADLYSPT